MGMGTRRRRQRQHQIWIAQQEIAKGPAHPFYARVTNCWKKRSLMSLPRGNARSFTWTTLVGRLWHRESIFVCCWWAILKGSIRSEESLGGQRILWVCGDFWESASTSKHRIIPRSPGRGG